MVESKKTQAAIAVLLIVCALFVLRAVVVGCYHLALCDAIYVYQLDCRATGRDADIRQEDKESYEDTYRRWWDWSDHNILPEDKYRRIRPYIGEDFKEWERRVSDG